MSTVIEEPPLPPPSPSIPTPQIIIQERPDDIIIPITSKPNDIPPTDLPPNDKKTYILQNDPKPNEDFTKNKEEESKETNKKKKEVQYSKDAINQAKLQLQQKRNEKNHNDNTGCANCCMITSLVFITIFLCGAFYLYYDTNLPMVRYVPIFAVGCVCLILAVVIVAIKKKPALYFLSVFAFLAGITLIIVAIVFGYDNVKYINDVMDNYILLAPYLAMIIAGIFCIILGYYSLKYAWNYPSVLKVTKNDVLPIVSETIALPPTDTQPFNPIPPPPPAPVITELPPPVIVPVNPVPESLPSPKSTEEISPHVIETLPPKEPEPEPEPKPKPAIQEPIKPEPAKPPARPQQSQTRPRPPRPMDGARPKPRPRPGDDQHKPVEPPVRPRQGARMARAEGVDDKKRAPPPRSRPPK